MKTFKVLHEKEPKFEGVEFEGGRVAIYRAEIKQVESWDTAENMLLALGEKHEIVWDK